jgi:Sulfotransferase family
VAVNSYVFIVGCPRSETTLLQRIDDAHPDIAVAFESHSIPRWLEKRRGDYNLEYLRESYGLATDHMRRIYNGLDQLHKLKPGRHKKRVCER